MNILLRQRFFFYIRHRVGIRIIFFVKKGHFVKLFGFFLNFQLLFDSFHIGKYNEYSYDACPNGYMQIMELGRPFTGGSWCGFATSLPIYYSETSTITATIKFFHFYENSNFLFKIRYRFLKDDEVNSFFFFWNVYIFWRKLWMGYEILFVCRKAVVRYGNPSEPLERGEPVPGTYCSRIFYECSKKKCRVQSPNFPGMYPRNVTCYLNLRQKIVPTCKHAMISVKQENSYKIQIKVSNIIIIISFFGFSREDLSTTHHATFFSHPFGKTFG